MKKTRETGENREARGTRKNIFSKRETTLLELTAMVLKQQILTEIREEGMVEFVDDLVSYRTAELVKKDTVVTYNDGIEAFTCEICSDRLYIMKHSSVNMAILYAIQNIGEISIVFNSNIVVVGGIQNKEIVWKYTHGEKLYSVKIGNRLNKEYAYKGIVYSTVEV